MLLIELKNGEVIEFAADEFTDYDWRPDAFIVIKKMQWIAIFNWSEVRKVMYCDGEITE